MEVGIFCTFMRIKLTRKEVGRSKSIGLFCPCQE